MPEPLWNAIHELHLRGLGADQTIYKFTPTLEYVDNKDGSVPAQFIPGRRYWADIIFYRQDSFGKPEPSPEFTIRRQMEVFDPDAR